MAECEGLRGEVGQLPHETAAGHDDRRHAHNGNGDGGT